MIRTLRWFGHALPALFLAASSLQARAPGTQTKDYGDHRVVRVQIETTAQLRELERIGATILDCIPGVGAMTVLATADHLTAIESHRIGYEPLLDSVDPLIEAGQVAAVRADPFADFFLDYHEYGDAQTAGTIVWYMHELVARHSELAEVFTIGNTLQGRPIFGVRIGHNVEMSKPGVVCFGCEHAREWITTTVPTFLATYLLERYGTDPVVTSLVDTTEFYLIPVFNVDGYVYSGTTDRFWRKNRRLNTLDGSFGVDLNRNWGAGWGGPGAVTSPDGETYRGTAPFSEPETQALRDFFLDHPGVRAQVDVHSFGQLILWPYGYTSALSADQAIYEEIGLAMQSLIGGVHGRTYQIGPVYSAIYPASGVSLDWTYSELGLLSFTLELRPNGGWLSAFDLPADQIISNNEEIVPAVLHIAAAPWVHEALRFRFPDGLPRSMVAGADQGVRADIVGQNETPVPGGLRLHYRYDSSGSFVALPLSSVGGATYEATLPATNCTSEPEYYISAQGDGGTVMTSPEGAPGVVYEAPITTAPLEFFSEKLSQDPGWSTEGSWAWGLASGRGGQSGGPDPIIAHEGFFLYGYNLHGDYERDMPEYHLTSPPIDCRNRTRVHLAFWRWLGVEHPDYDRAAIQVSADGRNWTTVWENEGEIADTSWVYQEIDISSVADGRRSVRVRWSLGPTDSQGQYCGWNIDDVSLIGKFCEWLAGDFDVNGSVDNEDRGHLEKCLMYDAGKIGPGCGVFDFDGDGDVDCADWVAFRSAWTSTSDPLLHETCDAFTPPVARSIPHNRYVSFDTAGSLGQRVAFRVTTQSNALFSTMQGQQKWVAPPDDNGVSRLECFPTFFDWQYSHVEVADRDIVPGATYAVEATLDGVTFLEPVSLETVSLWGDVAGPFEAGAWTPSDGVLDMIDPTAQIDAFRNLNTAPPIAWCDTSPARPDGEITMVDILHVVNAFGTSPYRLSPPTACP